jgi:hypothetical protein
MCVVICFQGHRKLVAAAQARIQRLTSALEDGKEAPAPLPVIYELAALNADKVRTPRAYKLAFDSHSSIINAP